MDAGRELNNIRSELQSIIWELRSISDGLNQDFAGISSGVCASRVNEVANQYQGYLNRLNNARVVVKSDGNFSGGGGNGGGGGASGGR